MTVQKSFGPPDGRGTLYLVGTPIGNLEDMTYRAVRTLKEADWIAAEDTRQTRKLLNHYDISTRLFSYHEHNKASSGEQIIEKLLNGESVALVSDAGLPAISDPGYELVCEAASHQLRVVPIPGANAALSALIVSGLPTDRFTFVGFLPREQSKLKQSLEQLKPNRHTLLFYESPYRIVNTLKAMQEGWGNRHVALVRELTKRFEEIWRGTTENAIQWLREHPPKGEYCIVVEGASKELSSAEVWWGGLSIEEHFQAYIAQGTERKQAMKQVAVDRSISKRDVYQSLL